MLKAHKEPFHDRGLRLPILPKGAGLKDPRVEQTRLGVLELPPHDPPHGYDAKEGTLTRESRQERMEPGDGSVSPTLTIVGSSTGLNTPAAITF